MSCLTSPRRRAAIVLVGFSLSAALAVLIFLGLWQLERGAEKTAIKAAFEERMAEPAIRMGADPLDPELFEFYRVEARGVYRPEHQILIDNRIRGGRPGFGVITPLELAGSRMHVLVDRGWIPWNPDRTQLPEVPTPTGEQLVTGVLKRPAADFYTLESSKPDERQKVWQNLDFEHYGKIKDFKLQELVILLAPDAAAGGFARDLPVYTDDWIARHRGYAIQWFGLAAVLVVVFLVIAFRTERHGDNG